VWHFQELQLSAFPVKKAPNPMCGSLVQKHGGPFDKLCHARVAIHTFVYQSATNNEAHLLN
jgi:hypothetical protein